MAFTVKFRLANADRERFDCPEWIEVDPLTVSVREAVALQRGVDLGDGRVRYPSPSAWWNVLAGEPVTKDDGSPELVTVDGTEVQLRRPSYAALTFLVWMGLRRNGKPVELEDLDYDVSAFQIQFVSDTETQDDEDDQDQASEGKGEETEHSDESSVPSLPIEA